MKDKKWSGVFANYPKLDEIFICDGQPFTEKSVAESYMRSINRATTAQVSVETVQRADDSAEKEGKAAAEKEAKAKAAAEKKAKTAATRKAKAAAKKAAAEKEKTAE